MTTREMENKSYWDEKQQSAATNFMNVARGWLDRAQNLVQSISIGSLLPVTGSDDANSLMCLVTLLELPGVQPHVRFEQETSIALCCPLQSFLVIICQSQW